MTFAVTANHYKQRNYPLLLAAICTALLTLSAITYKLTIELTSDDGTEINKQIWEENGATFGINYLGLKSGDAFDAGFRFHLHDLESEERISYARLRFASQGSSIDSRILLLIEGVMQESPTTFDQASRPSQKHPKTATKILWEIRQEWLEGVEEVPLWYSSPDITPIINEILGQPGWGTGPEGKTLALTISGVRPAAIAESNYITYGDLDYGVEGINSVVLETYKEVYDTFLGREMLGRITDRSVTINLYSLIDTDIRIEYGTTPGFYDDLTPVYYQQPAEKSIEVVLDDLQPDTRYYYRLLYRRAGTRFFHKGDEHSFHTQRPRGSTFTFAIQADEHALNFHSYPEDPMKMDLYRTTLQNIAAGNPDFLVSLGDFAITEFKHGRTADTVQEAVERYLLQRDYIDHVTHSVPFYLAIGNHESEQGWYYDFSGNLRDNQDSLLVRSLQARKEIIPNPVPDGFYNGNSDPMFGVGLREDYFAWEWGDALFIVLDPYAYTRRKPMASLNGWDWTLGKEQYDWLFDTVNESTARWKIIFMHQIVSSSITQMYGRGGIEVAKHKVAANPSYEWGGENGAGVVIYETKRPGWEHGPIHDFLVEAGVTAVFHGHDHFFAYQELDGIYYIEAPRPDDTSYGWGWKTNGSYMYGEFAPNSGHLEVEVSPDHVKVDYIRAYLPGDGTNGEVFFSHTIE